MDAARTQSIFTATGTRDPMRLRTSLLAAAAAIILLAAPTLNAHHPGSATAFQGEPPEIRALLDAVADEVDGQNVYDCIDEITKDFPNSYRLMGAPTQQFFIEKYGGVFEEMGLLSQIVHFDEGGPGIGVPSEAQQGGTNIIGVLPGKDPTTWAVIGGHYDTRELTFGGGAHDNGSGLCTVKEVARVLSALDVQLEATVVFAWWDGEEWGLYGSRAFVADHNATKELLGLDASADVRILQGISIDMAGLVYPAHNPWANGGDVPEDPAPLQHFHLRGPPVTVQDDESWYCPSYGCYERLKERQDFERIVQDFTYYRAVVEEVWRNYLQIPEEHVSFEEDNYGRSDHVPFTAAGIPGLRVQGAHDDEYPPYHNPHDTLEWMQTVAGGQDLLVEGMDLETTTAALITTYVSAKGTLGPIGTAEAGNGTALEGDDEPAVPGPGIALALTGVALAVVATIGRRR
jgi:hypothetical protein